MRVRGPNNVRRAVETDTTCDIMGVVRPTMLRPFARGFNLLVTFKAPNDRLTLKLRNSLSFCRIAFICFSVLEPLMKHSHHRKVRLDSYHTINHTVRLLLQNQGTGRATSKSKIHVDRSKQNRIS